MWLVRLLSNILPFLTASSYQTWPLASRGKSRHRIVLGMAYKKQLWWRRTVSHVLSSVRLMTCIWGWLYEHEADKSLCVSGTLSGTLWPRRIVVNILNINWSPEDGEGIVLRNGGIPITMSPHSVTTQKQNVILNTVRTSNITRRVEPTFKRLPKAGYLRKGLLPYFSLAKFKG